MRAGLTTGKRIKFDEDIIEVDGIVAAAWNLIAVGACAQQGKPADHTKKIVDVDHSVSSRRCDVAKVLGGVVASAHAAVASVVRRTFVAVVAGCEVAYEDATGGRVTRVIRADILVLTQ